MIIKSIEYINIFFFMLGPEVAAYAASNLPKFLKDLPSYKTGKLAQALEDAFLGFDEKLTRPEVIKELKELAGMPSDDNKEEGEGVNDIKNG